MRRLDVGEKVLLSRKINKFFDEYPKLRNERLGHGYTFGDASAQFVKSLQAFFEDLFSLPHTPLSREMDLIHVQDESRGMYLGVIYKPDGFRYDAWQCPTVGFHFVPGSLYCHDPEGDSYHRLSPFVHMEDEESFYIYGHLQEPLNGTVMYNQLLKTNRNTRDWVELRDPVIESDTLRRRCKNRTIINHFDPNYRKYIDHGILKDRLRKFLLANKSSVCATVWGHGGVGKTATVQSLCEDLIRDSTKFLFRKFGGGSRAARRVKFPPANRS